MTNNLDIRASLRDWLKNTKAPCPVITDETPLLDTGIISSLKVMDLLLYIEELKGSPLNISELKPGAIRSVNAIYQNFFEETKNVA